MKLEEKINIDYFMFYSKRLSCFFGILNKMCRQYVIIDSDS